MRGRVLWLRLSEESFSRGKMAFMDFMHLMHFGTVLGFDL
jgi:hypothetical protein